MEPRLIELCFQTAGIWELGVQGRMGLPQHVTRSLLVPDAGGSAMAVYAVVTPDAARGRFDAEVLDEKGNCYCASRDIGT